jgi:hypothetical protein
MARPSGHPEAMAAGRGCSDRQACCAACHWGEPGFGPPAGAAFQCWPLLGGALPGAMLGKAVGTPATPCLPMHTE